MYCSIQDVRNRNKSLLTPEVLTDGEILDCIDNASAIAEGMLGNRYALPLTPVPKLLKKIVADLAGSEAIETAVGNTGGNDDPIQADNLYNRAMSLLEKIRDGKISLAGNSAGVMAVASGQDKRRDFEDWDPDDFFSFR